MATKIFVNLPVNDLKKSMEFFTKLHFTFNPQFTDETAACMVVSEDIFVMLLTRDKFKTFTPKTFVTRRKAQRYWGVCLVRAETTSTTWSARPLPAAAQPTMSHKTTALCMAMAFRTSMAISGN
jgi:hypothetical protein